MDTTTFVQLFQAPGPFATVLIDVSRDSEDGGHEHELRVRAACESLTSQGAPVMAVDAVRERLSEVVGRSAPVARLVVATAEGVQHDETAGVRIDDPVATWGPLPDLAAWLEHRDSALTFVLALVDHEGGDVAVYDSDVPAAQEQASVGGETHHAHQVPVGGWSALRYQHVTENVWARNAEAVVDEVAGHVRAGRDLVLLAGDPQSVAMVRAGLADTGADVVELPTGTRAEDGGDEALQQAVREALMGEAVSRRLAHAHELEERLGRDHAVATGVADVADAFVRGQVDTLLLDPRAAAEETLSLADHPGLALGSVPPQGPLPVDQALVAAAVLTDARIVVTPAATLKGSPAVALLRWDQEAQGTG